MTLNTQLMTIVVMTLMGLEFAAAYDTYMRLFRGALSKRWILLICDIIFMIGQAFCLFYLLYIVNDGEIRIYIVIALVCGYAIYQSLLRRIYIELLEKLIKFYKIIYRIIRKILDIFLLMPIKLIQRMLVKCAKTLYFIAKRCVKVVILVLYKILSPILLVVKIIPIKYRIKTKVKFEKIILKIKNYKYKFKKK